MSSVQKKKQSVSLNEKKNWHGHSYQRRCVIRGFEQKLLALFLDPGLGKTSIILQLFKMLRLYKKVEKVLIIAPIRVCYLVWPLEINKWKNFNSITYNILHGLKKDLWNNIDADFHIVNPDGLPWLLEQIHGKQFPFDMLVCDESTLFKNHNSTRFDLIKYIVPKFNRRYILTGTPIPNGYEQLFPQMQIIDEGKTLGTKITHYRQRHFFPTGNPAWYQWKLREGEDEIINERIASFVVRMSAEDYLDLPPLIENKIFIDLPNKSRKQYDTLKKNKFVRINKKDVCPPNAASLCQKLHQICNGNLYEDWDELELGKVPPAKERPYFKIHREKILALEELIHELRGKPLFVAYWYHHELQELQRHFKKCKVINSKTTEKQAQKIEQDWNAGKISLLFAQPASVAHGLNFQYAGGDVCWFSLIYDFEIKDQFTKRLWRQGASKSVREHYILVRSSIDEAIYDTLKQKEIDQNEFFKQLLKHQ